MAEHDAPDELVARDTTGSTQASHFVFVLYWLYIDRVRFFFVVFLYAIVVVFISSPVTFNELLINCSRIMHERIVVGCG